MAYAIILVTVPMMVVSSINFYAARMVSYSSSATAVSENLSVPQAPQEPVGSTASAIAITTLPPAGTEPDPGLKEILNSWAAKNPNQKWGVVVQGVGEEKRFAKLNPDEVFRSASLYKLLLMYPLLQKHPVEKFGSINTAAGKLSDCATLMLKTSDNPCGEAVGVYVGWPNADVKLKEIGLKNTKLNSSTGPTTTANDINTYLKELHSGPKFSQEGRDFIISTLRNQIFRKGIPTGCNGCLVADKIGDLTFVRHDVGIVEHPGGTYLLSILTSGASYSQIAQLTAQIHEYMSKPY